MGKSTCKNVHCFTDQRNATLLVRLWPVSSSSFGKPPRFAEKGALFSPAAPPLAKLLLSTAGNGSFKSPSASSNILDLAYRVRFEGTARERFSQLSELLTETPVEKSMKQRLKQNQETEYLGLVQGRDRSHMPP